MAAPPKPWDRRLMSMRQQSHHYSSDQMNGRIPNQISPQTGLSGVPTDYGNPGPSPRPVLPPRPNTNMMTRNAYSPYGMAGSSYSPYGGGGYSLGYGGIGGYGSYGMMGPHTLPTEENEFIRAAEESSQQAFSSIASIVHAFGSVNMMLESTYQAVYSSFHAVLGVAHQFSRMRTQFAQILSAFAVIRSLKWLLRRLLYLIGMSRQDPSLDAAWDSLPSTPQASAPGSLLTEADLKAHKSSWPIAVFSAVVLGVPYLMWRLLASARVTNSTGWTEGQGEHYRAEALYDFQSADSRELSFRFGSLLYLAPKELQPAIQGWLLAADANDGRRGLVPANYLRIASSNTGLINKTSRRKETNAQLDEGDIPLQQRNEVVEAVGSEPTVNRLVSQFFPNDRTDAVQSVNLQLGMGLVPKDSTAPNMEENNADDCNVNKKSDNEM